MSTIIKITYLGNIDIGILLMFGVGILVIYVFYKLLDDIFFNKHI